MQEILHYLDNENRMGRYFFANDNKALQQFILSEAILDFEQWTLDLRRFVEKILLSSLPLRLRSKHSL
jgi:hypothetical protein